MQGEGLAAPVSCIFGNGSQAQTVAAKVLSPWAATCTAPQWPGSIMNRTNGARLLQEACVHV